MTRMLTLIQATDLPQISRYLNSCVCVLHNFIASVGFHGSAFTVKIPNSSNTTRILCSSGDHAHLPPATSGPNTPSYISKMSHFKNVVYMELYSVYIWMGTHRCLLFFSLYSSVFLKYYIKK